MSIWDSIWPALVGAIVGGALTGYFALRATDKAHRQQMDLQDDNRKKLINGFLQAVHDEVETLWESYQTGVGVQLEALSEGYALLMYYPVTQDYFTVYTTNGYLIGHVTDPDLRRLIVQVYSKARGLIDSYRMNNEFVGKIEHWQLMLSEGPNEHYQRNRDAYLNNAQQYARRLRQSHDELKQLTGQLLRSLRQMGVISKPVIR